MPVGFGGISPHVKKILLVDDDRLARVTIAAGLRAHGLDVLEAEDGEEALAYWRPLRFDTVVSDILMPGIDGLELARRIRALEQSNGVPAARMIALSASLAHESEERRVRACFDALLAKPVPLRTLIAALERGTLDG